MAASSVTPVTVLTGFLGSGKTTLLNRVVEDSRFRDTAIVVNEWGAVPIDHALLRSASGVVAVLAGGCICCRAAGDVVRALRELHFERVEGRIPAFSRVVIETTGLADPAPLLATLVEMPLVAARYALAGVVTTLDAEHGMKALDAYAESVKQAAVADRLVVTKVDRVPTPRVEMLEARLRDLNPGARLLRSPPLDVGHLLDTGLYRGPGVPMDAHGWLGAGVYRHAGRLAAGRHDAGIDSFTWTRQEPCDWDSVETALATLLELRGAQVLRLKGLVNVAGEAGPRAIHAVQHTLYPSARLQAWPGGDHATRLVFILRDLEAGEVAAILDSIVTPATS